MLILKLIRIVLIAVFLTINRLKGWFLPALDRQGGYSPPSLLREAFGWGVEKTTINLLLIFMNTGTLRLKIFFLSFSRKLAHRVVLIVLGRAAFAPLRFKEKDVL